VDFDTSGYETTLLRVDFDAWVWNTVLRLYYAEQPPLSLLMRHRAVSSIP
jgi:hypothetical protein